jgi:hypothetical protein
MRHGSKAVRCIAVAGLGSSVEEDPEIRELNRATATIRGTLSSKARLSKGVGRATAESKPLLRPSVGT